MITKAIIEKVISDYEVKVRIPLLDSTTAFKQSVDIDGLSSATICISPKSRFIPAVGDIVFVAFEDNDAGKPVIIGCLQKETGNISSLDLNVESLNASSSINLSNNTTIGDLSYEKINSLFDIKDQEIDELKKRDIVKLYDAVGQNIDGAMTQKATTDALAKKMDNFSISIGSTNGGNPRQVKFMSINYTTATSEAGVSIKLSMVSGHGNGSSYRFLQDAILGVTYTGVVSIDVYKYYNASVGTFDGAVRNYGDIFYVKDETNKIVDFYVLLGQYSTVKVTPYFRLNASTGGVITQLSGTPTYYSSGTKVYGNNSLYAKNSDIPIVSQSTGTSTTEVMSQKATTDALANKLNKSDLLNKIYPVGSVYISTEKKSPASFLGGIWTQILGKFLLSSDDFLADDGTITTKGSYHVNDTGGEATHTLTIDEMPSHTHSSQTCVGWQTGGGNSVGRVTSNNGDYNGWPTTIYNTGGSQAHNNMPPYYTVYMWRRISGDAVLV